MILRSRLVGLPGFGLNITKRQSGQTSFGNQTLGCIDHCRSGIGSGHGMKLGVRRGRVNDPDGKPFVTYLLVRSRQSG